MTVAHALQFLRDPHAIVVRDFHDTSSDNVIHYVRADLDKNQYVAADIVARRGYQKRLELKLVPNTVAGKPNILVVDIVFWSAGTPNPDYKYSGSQSFPEHSKDKAMKCFIDRLLSVNPDAVT